MSGAQLSEARTAAWRSHATLLLLTLLVLMTAGCSSLPPLADAQRPASVTLAPPAGAPLARIAAALGPDPKTSGYWPLAQGEHALDARLALIRHAQSSIDVQTYILRDDGVGRMLLRELRDAAARGVRVRLLLDDLTTLGLDALLLGLQAHPNVEVRVYNAFGFGRSTALGRLAAFATDFDRLTRRMHNKLLVADASAAILGGRNWSDEYFQRASAANFVDLDLLVVGPIVQPLAATFDDYWNSRAARPLQTLAQLNEAPGTQRAAFDRAVAAPPPLLPTAPDAFGAPPLTQALAAGTQPRLITSSSAEAGADKADKGLHGTGNPPFDQTLTYRFVEQAAESRRELLIVSPYFIPGEQGLKRMRQARAAGVRVRVVTTAFGSSDVGLTAGGYDRYRLRMLDIGVELYEMSSARLSQDASFRHELGTSRGLLHAKMALIDDDRVLVGSLNLDPRSTYLNTELGVAVQSRELARLLREGLRIDDLPGTWRVRLDAAGRLEWVARDASGAETAVTDEPEVNPWQRLWVWLVGFFVPESQL